MERRARIRPVKPAVHTAAMTPQEWKFVEHLVVESCKWAYDRREQETIQGKPLNTNQFVLNNGDRLKLKTELKKFIEKR